MKTNHRPQPKSLDTVGAFFFFGLPFGQASETKDKGAMP
jgi:hypothetical protein